VTAGRSPAATIELQTSQTCCCKRLRRLEKVQHTPLLGLDGEAFNSRDARTPFQA
jgi:hypothetical protein